MSKHTEVKEVATVVTEEDEHGKKEALKESGLVVVGAVATGVTKVGKVFAAGGRKTKAGFFATLHSPKVAKSALGTKLAEHRALNAFEEKIRLEKIQAGQALLVAQTAQEEVK